MQVVLPVRPEQYLAELRSEDWPNAGSLINEVLDDGALVGHPPLAEFFVAVARLIDTQDELVLSRFGADVLQDWIRVADHVHPEALEVLSAAVPAVPVLGLAIEGRMNLNVAELVSDAGRQLAATVQTVSKPGRA